MNETTAPYGALSERLAAVADAMEPTRWNHPSPCDEWSAADVIEHLIETQRDFLVRHDLDPGDAPDVHGDPAKAWRAHAEQVTDLLDRPGVTETRFDGSFGPATIGDTITRFYGFDMIVHRWDVARAAGIETTFSPEELDQIENSIDSFGETLYADGICDQPVDIDPSAPRQQRLLARMGRDPR